MTGWQRFGLMLLCYFGVMVLFPNYDAAGFYFAGITLMMWTGVILILAVINNILGLYNFPNFCRFITLVFIAAVLFSLLWYFPQKDNVTPINKLKYGEFPTMQDVKRGINRFAAKAPVMPELQPRFKTYEKRKASGVFPERLL